MALTIIEAHYTLSKDILATAIQVNTITAYYDHLYLKKGIDTINNITKYERREYHDYGLAWFQSLPEVISIHEPIEDRRI